LQHWPKGRYKPEMPVLPLRKNGTFSRDTTEFPFPLLAWMPQKSLAETLLLHLPHSLAGSLF